MGKNRILVVDDDPMVLRLLDNLLTGCGYQVLLAEDGETGLQIARSERPRLIILDLLLPGIDGFQVCRALKASEETRDMRVIMLTGVYDTARDARFGMQTGAARYLFKGKDGLLLGKPFDTDHLLQVIRDELSDAAGSTDLPRERVLIVDDDKLSQALLQRSLEEAGYVVLLATDGESALQMIGADRPDLVLLDYLLPGLDGLAILKQARQQYPEMAIVFMTAYGSEDVAVQALRQGADDYLIKPFRPWGVAAVVEENLEKGRQRRLTRSLIEELNRSNQRLREQQQELQSQNKALQELDQLREDLLSMVVHDLKNPLAVMITATELMGEDFGPVMDEEQQSVLTSSRRASTQLMSLVNNLLDVQRLEAGRMPLLLEDLDLKELVTHVLTVAVPRLRGARITVRSLVDADLPLVRADMTIIQRVLDNLLDNAIKFTPVSGVITVEAKSGESVVLISVADTGEGVPESSRTRVFEKFEQLKPAGTGQRGSGLGLTFCKLAVEAHNGSIWIEDNEPRGSRFVFSLPLRATDALEIV
jgi:two-component system, sensor histidine kinase and response regulator